MVRQPLSSLSQSRLLTSFILHLFVFFFCLSNIASKWEIFKKIVERTIKLFLLGLVIQGFRTNGVLPWPYCDLYYLRIMGILQRIAICYFVSGVAFLLCPIIRIEKDPREFPRFRDIFLHVVVKYIALWSLGILFMGAYAALTFGLYVPDYKDLITW